MVCRCRVTRSRMEAWRCATFQAPNQTGTARVSDVVQVRLPIVPRMADLPVPRKPRPRSALLPRPQAMRCAVEQAGRASERLPFRFQRHGCVHAFRYHPFPPCPLASAWRCCLRSGPSPVSPAPMGQRRCWPSSSCSCARFPHAHGPAVGDQLRDWGFRPVSPAPMGQRLGNLHAHITHGASCRCGEQAFRSTHSRWHVLTKHERCSHDSSRLIPKRRARRDASTRRRRSDGRWVLRDGWVHAACALKCCPQRGSRTGAP